MLLYIEVEKFERYYFNISLAVSLGTNVQVYAINQFSSEMTNQSPSGKKERNETNYSYFHFGY